MDEKRLRARLGELAQRHGHWLWDVPLGHGLWTGGNRGLPQTRLKRIVQVVHDLVRKPLSECRILDLASLEGQFAIEMAHQGAAVVGIELREANIEKARFLKEALGLRNLAFHQDDVRNISVEKYGRFDAIICSGILYHLRAGEAIDLARAMHAMAERAVIIDTHVSLRAEQEYRREGKSYWGRVYAEHRRNATAAEKAENRLASADNETSFWFTRPSLINLLSDAGFSSIYECFVPIHMNRGRKGTGFPDRCTFACLRDPTTELVTSPAANLLREQWPEGTLSYAPPTPLRRAKAAIGRMARRVRAGIRQGGSPGPPG